MKTKLLMTGLFVFSLYAQGQDKTGTTKLPDNWKAFTDTQTFQLEYENVNNIQDLIIDHLNISAIEIKNSCGSSFNFSGSTDEKNFKEFGGGTNTIKLSTIAIHMGSTQEKLNDLKIKITAQDVIDSIGTPKVDSEKKSILKSINITLKINTGDDNALTQMQQQLMIRKLILLQYGRFIQLNRNPKNNLIISNNTVHVFLDEYGKTYYGGFPTTAREDYNYSFHVFYDSKNTTSESIDLSVNGIYDPTFSVYGSENIDFLKINNLSPQSTGSKDEKKSNQIQEILYDNIGPFTNTFTVDLTKTIKNDKSQEPVIQNKVVRVAPLHHISLMVGLVSSSLSNPTNIEKGLKANGDSTLFANDPNARGLITLMAVFYPQPRNLLFPPEEFITVERLGFVIGTRIDTELTENFLAGFSYDVARGLSITSGVHYGRVNTVAGYPDFNFGKDTFSGELITKKEWQVGFFVGANIDLRVFGLLFNPQGQTK